MAQPPQPGMRHAPHQRQTGTERRPEHLAGLGRGHCWPLPLPTGDHRSKTLRKSSPIPLRPEEAKNQTPKCQPDGGGSRVLAPPLPLTVSYGDSVSPGLGRHSRWCSCSCRWPRALPAAFLPSRTGICSWRKHRATSRVGASQGCLGPLRSQPPAGTQGRRKWRAGPG